MKRIIFTAIIFIVQYFAQPQDTLKLDAVELINGIELEGKTDYEYSHQGYLYLFKSKENLEIFKQNFWKYEIQLGGGCGRMGSLSGPGTTDIFTVHNNKIYIFASQSCKKAFIENSEKLIEKDDPLPRITKNQSDKGKALLEKIIEYLGGEESICSLYNYEIKHEKEVEYNGENIRQSETNIFQYPNEFKEIKTWDKHEWVKVVKGQDGYFLNSDTKRKMYKPQIDEFYRAKSHDLIYLIKSRDEAGFTAFSADDEFLNGKKCNILYVHLKGALTKIYIDSESGEIYAVAYRGRGPKSFYGNIMVFFSQYKIIEGIKIPQIQIFQFDGELVAELTKVLKEIEIKADLSDKF